MAAGAAGSRLPQSLFRPPCFRCGSRARPPRRWTSAPSGWSLPPFSAGAHVDVEVKPGLVRQCSPCNDPAESHRYPIGVLRDPASRGGSSGTHTAIDEGAIIRYGAPRNRFALAPAAGRSLLLAGGIGVTPIFCMAERLYSTGADFRMHDCTRSKDRTAFFGRIRDSAFADRSVLQARALSPRWRASRALRGTRARFPGRRPGWASRRPRGTDSSGPPTPSPGDCAAAGRSHRESSGG